MSNLKIAGGVTLDLLRLVDSRMLIQANSGGGKSWLLRLIAEEAASHVQTIILDPEGEFATLREKFDFLLVGQAGEIPAEPRAAGLLARRLLELQASAVIDLYDLRLPDRRRFVRLFLESLMHLPKGCWHPLLVMIDEAHLLCPERSAGEAESTNAVIDLMSQGRKRSYCGILATQRLSKLHKDAEAETNNVFVGRTWLDIDQKRAGDLLGFGKEQRQDLRDLEYEFFAFGPALSANGIVRLKPRQVQTTHPKAGQRHKLTPPQPSEAVRRIVADLADLPQQVEAEVRGLVNAKKKIGELERQLRAKPAEQVRVEVPVEIEVPVLKNGQLDKAHRVIDRLEKFAGEAVEAAKELATAIGTKLAKPPSSSRPPAPSPRPLLAKPLPPPRPREAAVASDGETPRGGLRRMIIALAQRPQGMSARQLGVRAGLSSSSGTFSTYLGKGRSNGWIDGPRERMTITDGGLAALGDFDPLPSGPALLAYWIAELGGGAARMLEALAQVYPESMTAERLSECAALSSNSGTFSTYLGKLRTLELVEGSRDALRASAELFE